MLKLAVLLMGHLTWQGIAQAEATFEDPALHRMSITENDGFGQSAPPRDPLTVPEATTGFQTPMATGNYGNLYNRFYAQYCDHYNPPGSYHPGVDLNQPGTTCDEDRGTDILAVANGTVVYADTGDWGGVVIQHRWRGEICFSQYGHLDSALVAVGQNVTKGQHIGELGDVGTPCAHLHWEIREADHPNPTFGAYWVCAVLRDSSLVEAYYENPEVFVAAHGPYNTYGCRYVSQDPPGAFWVRPGELRSFSVTYRNAGTATWENQGGVGNPNYVELRSCDSLGVVVNSWLEPVDWIGCPTACNRQRVTTCDEATVAPDDSATFAFHARIPPAATHLERVYFRPVHDGGQVMEDWGGMHFQVNVDADPPAAPPNLAVNPAGCPEANSFAFSWGPSSDIGSGVVGYLWSVNGSQETRTPATALPAGPYARQVGLNTFAVVALDSAQNRSTPATVPFCWDPNPEANLSFERDLAPPDGIPDRWSLLNLNGAVFIYGTAVPGELPDASSRYVAFTHTAPNHWSAIGTPASPLIQPETWCRIAFWYRTTDRLTFGFRLGAQDLASASLPIGGEVLAPWTGGAWHRFWSAPFRVTAAELTTYPMLAFYDDYGNVGTVAIDAVEVLPSELCQ